MPTRRSLGTPASAAIIRSIQRQLRQLCEDKGIGATDLALRAGSKEVNARTIGSYWLISDRFSPTVHTLVKIAAALNCTISIRLIPDIKESLEQEERSA